MSRFVRIEYTNHRGKRRKRVISPNYLRFTSTQWYPEPQWILYAVDYEKGEERGFAMQNIHLWEVEKGGDH